MAAQPTRALASPSARRGTSRSGRCGACATIIRTISSGVASAEPSLRSSLDRLVAESAADAGKLATLVARQLGSYPGALRRIVEGTLRADPRGELAIRAALAGDPKVSLRAVVAQPKARDALLQGMWAVSPALTHAIAGDAVLASEVLHELVRELRSNSLLSATVCGELHQEQEA
jgi:hypothetical protein